MKTPTIASIIFFKVALLAIDISTKVFAQARNASVAFSNEIGGDP